MSTLPIFNGLTDLVRTSHGSYVYVLPGYLTVMIGI